LRLAAVAMSVVLVCGCGGRTLAEREDSGSAAAEGDVSPSDDAGLPASPEGGVVCTHSIPMGEAAGEDVTTYQESCGGGATYSVTVACGPSPDAAAVTCRGPSGAWTMILMYNPCQGPMAIDMDGVFALCSFPR
jgi:hypothetical protein